MRNNDSEKFVSHREKDLWSNQPLMERTGIKKDTYLNCFCPHCGTALNESDKAVFRIVNKQGQEGISRIVPYLNVLDRESTINVADDEELSDVRCPHCDESLIEPDQICKFDNCKMIKFNISVSDSIKLSITLCVLRTCRWYTMSEEDNERLILRESHEW